MTCPHQSRTRDRGAFTCALGWYGGHPFLGNCRSCIANGRNTPEARANADAKAERTHPSSKPRLSGCCDRADQS
jgi:hypothetical protein